MKLALHLQALQHLADLRAAAVHDNRVDADLLEQHDVAGEDIGQLLVAHGMAAVFDDEGLAGVAPHEGQGLGDRPAVQPTSSLVSHSPAPSFPSRHRCPLSIGAGATLLRARRFRQCRQGGPQFGDAFAAVPKRSACTSDGRPDVGAVRPQPP